tara:strand:- start:2 stop:679 length:678 start_codon:yes stop_codon:yes gene_type:complete
MKANILIVIISCEKHKHIWGKIFKKGLDNIIIICGKESITKNNEGKEYILDGKILYLNCNDNYEGLPEKIIYAINSILEIEKFKNYTHVMKIDDHDNNFDYTLNDKIASHIDINSINSSQEFLYDYLGQRMHTYIMPNWHINKCSPSSHWNKKSYDGPITPYLDGGSSYILSRKAMEIIRNKYNFIDINSIRDKHIWEDLMIALILKENNIYPRVIPNLVIGDKK